MFSQETDATLVLSLSTLFCQTDSFSMSALALKREERQRDNSRDLP